MMAARYLKRWRRFRALAQSDRWLIVEAIILIGIVQAGLRTVRFATLLRLLAGARQIRAAAQHPPARIGWAIDAAARLMPGRNCLCDALAADVMLGRRGLQSILRLGVKKRDQPGVPLEAHAWVESEGAIVAGRLETLDDYRVFAAGS
jgi:hypothetical protein